MTKDWTQIFKRYKGQWVALDDDEETVLASGQTAKQALAAAQEQGYRRPILSRVPDELVTYIGGTR